ncbi:hypothetical protein [Providencia burhodogranariea]|uniref:Fimbrial protein n=1 Tax=Providencia burhodogranariea DSM 19968 TaxID=1141662 RepID=K8W654_9GAMM|nr:hypothetical protein [Providencia burhodogranariea]EKT55336.1 fimbrial protein [Providencia burhodogranariea DSM 19968]
MKKQKMIWLLPLIIGSIFSVSVWAKSLVANTPVKQSDYELSHQGLVKVNATVFNAPCNFRTDIKTRKTILTECGAGSVFGAMKVFDSAAKTPVSFQLYDVQRGYTHTRHAIYLRNGDNLINLPLFMESNRTYRLEVSYE